MPKFHIKRKKSHRKNRAVFNSATGKPIDLTNDMIEIDLDDSDDDEDTANTPDDYDDDDFFSTKSSAIYRLMGKSKHFEEPSGTRSTGASGETVRYTGPKAMPGSSFARKRKPRRAVRSRIPRWYPPAPDLAADSAPEPKDKEIKSLWGCKSVKEVGMLGKKWNRKFRQKCLDAIKRRKLDPDMRAMIELLLCTSKATTIPVMTNTKVGSTASRQFHAGLVTLVADNPDIEMALVTFISGDWATSHRKPVIELHQSQKDMQSTLRAMAPNYLGVTEIGRAHV